MFSEAYLLCKLTLGACGLIAGFKAYNENKNKLATSKYGNKRDLKRLLGDDGFILTKNYQLDFQNTLEHVLTLGPTGSKKTVGTYASNLLDDKFPTSSIVITDPSGELWDKTANYQKSIGRAPVRFSPLGNDAMYDLLEQCKDDREVKKLAQNILINGDLTFRIDTGAKLDGAEWMNMAQPLLTAALLYIKDKKGTIGDAIELLIDNTEEELATVFLSQKKSIQRQYKLFLLALESPKTASSIKITLGTKAQLFFDETIDRNSRKTDFKASDLREKPIALYINYPEIEAGYLAPYLACFYTQFIDQLMRIKGIPVIFFLEEMANIGHINNFSSIISVCRKRGMPFVCCLQSLTQLNQLYGEDNAMNILNNLKTKIILPGLSDLKALEYISKLCGNKEIMVNNSKTKKNLLDLDEVRRIEDDKAVIISQNKLPIIDDLNLYFKDNEYIKRSEM